MEFGVTFFIVAALVVIIWIMIEFKRMKHKIFAIFLIGAIIFAYLTFSISLGGQKADFTSVSGVIDAGEIYLSWLSGIFGKVKMITAYAIGLDWKDADNSSKAKS